ncbi:MAG: hypothetical protein Q9205_005633 [Flavoplaca limonia]
MPHTVPRNAVSRAASAPHLDKWLAKVTVEDRSVPSVEPGAVEIDCACIERCRDSLPAQVIVRTRLSRTSFLATIDYLQSVLSVVSALNVASVYAKAIEEIMEYPMKIAKDLNLLSTRDLEQLRMWNHDFPHKVDSCVHDLVLRHVQRSPHSPAVCSWDGDLTFSDLEKLSFFLARRLVNAGIRQETLVPVCFEKSLYAVVAMVAILRAGGAFVPLDPSHPKDRLKAIIDRAGAKVVVTSPMTAPLFCGISVSVVEVSPANMESCDASADDSLPAIGPSHAAFVLFTSGSTGQPKGIVQEHSSVCASAIAHGNAMHVTSESRVFQYAAFTFDVSMMDIFTTLIHGGCVCIPSEEDRKGLFTAVMNRMQVNWVLFTPSVASLIKSEDVPSLRTLVFGGEAVKQENVSRWVGKVRLFNCYGPAECGACAIGEFTHPDSRPANIGRQFGGELCWVIDPENHDRILPIGAVGELAVEGPTLARGYLDDPTKTQAAFIKSPRWPQGTGPKRPRRIYKTGDLVRQSSDGTFDFVGRKDLQVKVRGQRVEIGEVEHHISTYPGIFLSMAARPPSGPYSQTLVGVIQLANCPVLLDQLDHLPNRDIVAAKFDRGKLLQCLEDKLPNYMVPTHILAVTKLPLSVSGKIDRKVVDGWLIRTSRPVETPSLCNVMNTQQQQDPLANELSSKILSMVSEHDSSFSKSLHGTNFLLTTVGLDSIKIINLIMFIRQQYGVKIHLDLLMDPKSSVRTVSGAIANLQKLGGATAAGLKFDVMKEFRVYQQKALDRVASNGMAHMNVFLTGSTGYLGCRILRQLCENPTVRRILVHVRSQSSRHALERIMKAAKLAGWWLDNYVNKLEAWTGDLAQPKLGLGVEQWKRLCGHGSPENRVTAIIHNGATVNWNANFSALKASNVDSVMDLLTAAADSDSLTNFVYVSGGQTPKLQEENDVRVAEEISQSSGYAKTKFLSELLVKEYSRMIARSTQRICIVKPGYIIGSREDGIAVRDDFIWRLTASCAQIQSHSAEDPEAWLFVADVDRVADAVSDCCTTPGKSTCEQSVEMVKILDGLLASEFWSIIKQQLGIKMQSSGFDSWMNQLNTSIEAQGEKHPLWPLLLTIEQGQGRLGVVCTPPEMRESDRQRVREAVRKNVAYLIGIGFLSRSNELPKVQQEKIETSFVGRPFASRA